MMAALSWAADGEQAETVMSVMMTDVMRRMRALCRGNDHSTVPAPRGFAARRGADSFATSLPEAVESMMASKPTTLLRHLRPDDGRYSPIPRAAPRSAGCGVRGRRQRSGPR